MTGKLKKTIGAGAAALLLGAGTATAMAATEPLTTNRVLTGLTRPIFVTHAPGDFDRIYIIEKAGVIKVHNFATNTTSVFLNIDPIVGGGTSTSDERGLLGLAFHPDYQNNGFFYVNYTNTGGNTVVARYTATDPDVANPSSAQTVLTIGQPFSNHNGGWMGFGPNDGFLYISTGDGGSANDPGNRSQDITAQLLGKMLRIDINADDFPIDVSRNYAIPPDNPFVTTAGDDEIWAYGLRNAWRCSFDRQTGDLVIADVGQNAIEEINFQPASSAGGENYGWRCMEGTNCTGLSGCTCNGPTLILPNYQYTHGGSPFRCSVTGGYIYRGCAIPDLQGTYFFADYCSSQIWSLRFDGAGFNSFQDRTAQLLPSNGGTISNISSFGEDAFGELYICDQAGGEVFKIVPANGVLADCNADGIDDNCQILANPALDANGNGVLDSCEKTPCPEDIDGSGTVDLGDLNAVLGSFGQSGAGLPADINGSGTVDLGDLNAVLGLFGQDC